MHSKHISLSDCLCYNFWNPWPRKIIFGMHVYTASESSRQGRTSRSSSQGQGHKSKKTWTVIPPSLLWKICVVSLQMQWRKVHLSHSEYEATCLQPRVTPPAGACRLHISDTRTDRMLTERVCVSYSRVVCSRQKGSLIDSCFSQRNVGKDPLKYIVNDFCVFVRAAAAW